MDRDTTRNEPTGPTRTVGCPDGAPAASPGSTPEAPAPRDLSTGAAALSLGLILLCGLAIRLGLWAGAGASALHDDEREYNAIAVNLAQRGEFATQPGALTSIRPPLYPALIAGVYKAAGVENIRAVRLVQVGISLATVALVYALGAALGSRRVGVWAAGLYSVYPSMLVYDRLLLTEVLFTALLCGACLALVVARRRDSVRGLAAAGCLFGLGALARSILWPFPALLAAYLLLTWRGGAGRRVLAATTLAAAAYATIAPWAVRNTRLQHTFTVVDVMGGRNLMMGNYEFTPMFRAWDAISVKGPRAWDRVLATADPGFLRLTQGQKDKMAARAAAAYVRAHPVQTLRRDVVKFFNFWGLERELVAGASRGYFGPVSAPALVVLTIVIFGSYVAAVASGVFGMAVLRPADPGGRRPILLVVAYVCALHTLSFGHSRYHLPLIPLILVVGSAPALLAAREVWSRRRSAAFGLACAALGVLAVGWCLEVFSTDLGRFVGALRGAA
jgi:4-amino-4-deoxy-L-arabinose transferase-like glycosyltransferase